MTRKRKWDLDDHGQVHTQVHVDSKEEKNKASESERLNESSNKDRVSELEDLNESSHKDKVKELEELDRTKLPLEQPPPPKKPEISILDSAAVSNAKEAASRIAATLKDVEPSSIPPPQVPIKTAVSIASTIGLDDDEKKPQAEGRFKKTVDVNDSRHRYYLIKLQTLHEIEAFSGAFVSVRGKYYPDRSMATEKDPALCLDVAGHSQSVVDKAVERIHELMEKGIPPMRPTKELIEKVYAPFDPDMAPGINFRAKLLGPQGSFLRHIQNESGAKANLRGKSSGYIEIGQREDQVEPLHIYLTAERQVELDYARKLAEDLLATVKAEVDAARMNMGIQLGIPMGVAQPSGNVSYPYQPSGNMGYPYQPPGNVGYLYQMPQPAGYPYQAPQSAGYPYQMPQSTGYPYQTPQSTGYPYQMPQYQAYPPTPHPLSQEGESADQNVQLQKDKE